MADRLTIGVGVKLAELVPGRVSTEVDADLAHDTEATIAKARKFIAMYAERGVSKDKILIKIAATWEGIEAARQLQREGIDCNLTLIFNCSQALACAEAGVFLISPFVGRILDYYVAQGQTPASIDEDPGVVFVRTVYNEFKQRGSSTVVMGASFRSTAQIEALAGCDRLTISPEPAGKARCRTRPAAAQALACAGRQRADHPDRQRPLRHRSGGRPDGHRKAGQRHRRLRQGSAGTAQDHHRQARRLICSATGRTDDACSLLAAGVLVCIVWLHDMLSPPRVAMPADRWLSRRRIHPFHRGHFRPARRARLALEL